MNPAAELIAVRFALYVDLMLVFGLPLFALYSRLSQPNKGDDIASPLAVSVLAVTGAGLSIFGLLLIAAVMSDLPLFELNRESVDGLLNGTMIGTAGKVRTAALFMAALLSLWSASRQRTRWALQSCAGAIALATLAWTGHGAADEGPRGLVHLAADIVHLLAAGVWVGALAGLLLLILHTGNVGTCRKDRVTVVHRALAGFAAVGTASVGLIVLTGLLNSWFLVGFANIGKLASSLYGRLLLGKLVVFAAMLGLAGLNRWKLTPAIAMAGASGASGAMRSVRQSVTLEACMAIIVLGLVAWLGTLAPPLSG